PLYGVAERVGPMAVLEKARAAGIDALWLPAVGETPARPYELTGTALAGLTPEPFGGDVALGPYPVSVLDQANAMATFAAGGRRAVAHFVRRVGKDFAAVYVEAPPPGDLALARPLVDDLTWALSQNAAAAL